MRKTSLKLYGILLAAVPLLSGCEDSTRTVVEDGVINVSTSLIGSIARALVELAAEAAASG